MKKGILLPIFSLPSKYGIGDFGYEAYEFIDILSNNKIDYWEILPINSCFDSPYSPRSYYALNENFISLDKLKERGLIHSSINIDNTKDRIDYNNLDKDKYVYEAYCNFKIDDAYINFIQNKEIQNYATFMSDNTLRDEEYYLFIQYMLYIEWNELLTYAHQKNVCIIGDMPVYPDFNSAEVKYNKKYYQLNENNTLDYVSGAPADIFNSKGQKWGHPLYHFQNLKNNKYNYLINRFLHFNNLFDITRIDNFKTYEKYYKIPANGNANEGNYEDGPAYDFFNELFKYTTSDKYIVEDLGDVTDQTLKIRDFYNLKGMKIIQYNMDPSTNNNTVIYTGNHDCNTIMGWYNNLSDEDKNTVNSILDNNNIPSGKINNRMINYVIKLSSQNDFVIIPVQDILGLDSDGRINLPGIVDNSNWSWRLKDFDEFKTKIAELKTN